MPSKILITGIAGTGKSTICDQLASMGYKSYGIEDIDGLFGMYKKGTKEVFEDYDNANPEHIKNADWLCDIQKLKDLLSNKQDPLAFYCGVASNMDEVMPLFDKIILLKVDADILHQRLMSREGTEDIGNTEEGRQTVLGWKDWWEDEMVKKGAVVVNASGSPIKVAQQVIELAT